MEIPLSFEHSDSGPDNPQELINMMVEIDNGGGQAKYTLINTPGLDPYKDTGDTRESRGGYLLGDDSLLTVFGDTLYKITTAGVQTTIGTLSTSTGPVQFAENPTQVMLVDGGTTGYVYTIATSTLADIVSTITPESITFQNGYGIASENEEEKIFYSGVNDFSTWGVLDFVVAESLPDGIVAVYSNHNEVWAFGVKSTEVYYISPTAASVLVQRQGATSEVGCSSQYSVAISDNRLFWLDDKGSVRVTNGYNPVIVSTRKLERDIAGKDWTQAKGFNYVQNGHTFYILIVEDVCWGYDLSTQKWHKRSGFFEAWRANWIHQKGNLTLAGDRSNGLVYSLSTDVYTDNGNPIRWTATTGVVHNDRKRIKHRAIELFMETGLGAGQVMMYYSDDGGKTWSNESIKEYGPIGKYEKRLRWRRKGISRARIYKFEGTSELGHKLISAHLEGDTLGI